MKEERKCSYGCKNYAFWSQIENISQQWGFRYDFTLKNMALNIPDFLINYLHIKNSGKSL